MPRTITLTASAKYGYGGKQYIALITGRDKTYQFAREFVGTKGGKRKEDSEYMTDEPGLYLTCDIDRKGGKGETFHVIEQAGEELVLTTCTKEEAMRLAKLLDGGTSFADALLVIWPTKTPAELIQEKIDTHRTTLNNSLAKNDPEAYVMLNGDLGAWKTGDQVRRGNIITFREGEIARLERELSELTPAEVPAQKEIEF